ncbi:hypothetical protein [Arthrobacter sp. 31Y]|uniref:hypothetical protein n=1 Tax=Arthrobacter sp. 31Y TaxID=1115632 RepID=UPI000464AEF4|nr:hypothetical protein [Arthrobacter sp. 31Y]
MLICATCAVERDEPVPDLFPICADERQYVPVLVTEADRHWLGRNDPRVAYWSGSTTIAEGLALHQTGGALGNFNNVIDTGAKTILQDSAQRHAA